MKKPTDLVLYKSKDGGIQLDVPLEKDTIWLAQKQMARLFEKDAGMIGLHICNAFNEGELQESATTEDTSVVRPW